MNTLNGMTVKILTRAAQVFAKWHAGRARIAQRQREQQRKREHAQRVVPIEKLKRPFVFPS